ncbi:MAG: AAA family ATPase [Planctomycetes bacterium]|nr:AAA family ATPase [Planctomycetota bacterium]
MLSQNARKHFNIFKDPFIDDVQSKDDVFLSSEQRYIREAMWQTSKHGGFLAIVGESGAGKTVLRRDLLDRIKREGHHIIPIQPRIIDKGRLTAGLICDSIIRDISVTESIYGSLEAKARKIETLLTGSSRAGNTHVLIIEEAHDLHVKTLKYLKRFWELEDGFRKLLSIILIGQLELRDKLDERMNWEAREVIRRCEVATLEPLNGALEEYLELKFKRVGAKLNQVFDKKAFDGIRERLTMTRGGDSHPISMHYPLIVNNTVIKCMNLAAEIGSPKVTAEIAREV